MSRRAIVIVFAGSLAAFVCLGTFGVLISSVSSPTRIPPPELGGQRVPDRLYEIPFDRQYDVSCTFFGEEPTVFRNCKILSFTGGGEKSGGKEHSFSAAGFSTPYERYFTHWLVLKLADGRLAYIPTTAVKYIEEAAARRE